MIIDFHTHTFPEKIAENTIKKLASEGNIKNYSDGTNIGLKNSMSNAGIDYSVILPIATKPTQTEKINMCAVKINETSSASGLISFGSLHPDNDNYREIIKNAYNSGIKGFKIHPYYQNIRPDDIRILRITETLESYNMITIFHAGLDVGFSDTTMATPATFRRLYDEIKPSRLVLAHTGGFRQWNDVEKYLVGLPIYLDTSFTLGNIEGYNRIRTPLESKRIADEQFIRIVKNHGADHILFGSDSPWSSQRESLNLLDNCGITSDELNMIKGENAKRLLRL